MRFAAGRAGVCRVVKRLCRLRFVGEPLIAHAGEILFRRRFDLVPQPQGRGQPRAAAMIRRAHARRTVHQHRQGMGRIFRQHGFLHAHRIGKAEQQQQDHRRAQPGEQPARARRKFADRTPVKPDDVKHSRHAQCHEQGDRRHRRPPAQPAPKLPFNVRHLFFSASFFAG